MLGVSRVARTLAARVTTSRPSAPSFSGGGCRRIRWSSVSFHSSECAWGGADHETVDMDAFLARFKNHEQSGVPAGAGVETDTGARFDLARMRRLLSVLGNPQKGYPMIHVAGTKGKGSVVSLLASILRTAGLNVGTYKSPHVRSVSERIVCGPFPESERNGDTVSPSGLDVSAAEAVAKFLVEHETDQLTYFELLTAFAFLEFKKNKVDVAVVEVGVGGSTDATNVFESKDLAAAVLTALGDDHLDALGGSLGSVAAAKSGIVKYKRPVFMGKQPSLEHEAFLLSNIYRRGARLVDESDVDVVSLLKKTQWNEVSASPRQHVDFTIQSVSGDRDDGVTDLTKRTLRDVQMRLLGPHQRENAELAVRVAEFLRNGGGCGFDHRDGGDSVFGKITDAHVRSGLENATAPGCFEVLLKMESTTGSGGDTHAGDGETRGGNTVVVVADGAHTTDSASALFKTLRETLLGSAATDDCTNSNDCLPIHVHGKDPKKLAVVVAMASDKNHHGFMTQIVSANPDVVVFTETLVAGAGQRATKTETLRLAWDRATRDDDDDDGETKRNRKKTIVVSVPCLEDAMDHAMAAMTGLGGGVVCVTGSLNVIGRAETWANARKGP